ncbi:MAG: flavin monoamine oxidase family protein [bacterium]
MISRREFLSGLLAAGGGALLPEAAAAVLEGLQPPMVRGAAPRRVIVVGGGLAGLAAAWELQRRGIAVRVLEARDRLGGRTHTLRGYFAGGQYAELGGEYVDTNHSTVLAYMKEFGIPTRRVPKGREALYFNGQFRDADDIGAFGPRVEADIDRFDGQSAWLGTQIPDPRRPWRALDPTRLDRISLDEWMDRPNLVPFVKAYYSAWLSGCYATDLSDLSLLMYARDVKLVEHVPEEGFLAFRIGGGADALATAFGKPLGDRVELEAEVEAVEHDPAGVRVRYRRRGRVLVAEGGYAVLAVPTPILRQIEIRPGLYPPKREAVEGMAYGGLAKVLLQYRRRFWLRRGFSGFTITDLPIHCTWDTTGNQPGRRGILTCFLGGTDAEQLGRMRPDERIASALAQVERIYPSSRPLFEQGASIYWNDQRYTRGSYSHYRPGTMTAFGPVIALPEGRLHFAGEHTDVVQGFMEGALASGRRAAGEIARRAQGRGDRVAMWSLDQHLRRLERASLSGVMGG